MYMSNSPLSSTSHTVMIFLVWFLSGAGSGDGNEKQRKNDGRQPPPKREKSRKRPTT